MQKILDVSSLNFKYTGDYIFRDLHFSTDENTFNAVLGSDNSGKTTLMRILTGILRSNNNIIIDGISLNKKNLNKYSLLIGSFFFEDNIKFLFEDVMSELVFGLENLCYPKKDIDKRLKEIAKIFDIQKLIYKKIIDLSEFEQVKVGIASSLMHNPKVIFLDGVFDNLSYSEYLKLIKILNKYRLEFGLTILYTTNKLDNCLQADNIFLLDDKKINLCGDIDEFLSKDNMLVKLGINISPLLDMSLKLRFYDLTNKILMSPKEVVDELWK